MRRHVYYVNQPPANKPAGAGQASQLQTSASNNRVPLLGDRPSVKFEPTAKQFFQSSSHLSGATHPRMDSKCKQGLLATPQPVPPPTPQPVPPPTPVQPPVNRQQTSSATHTSTANETKKKRDDHLLEELKKIRKTYTSLTANDMARSEAPTKKLTLSEYRSKTPPNKLTSSESKAGLSTSTTHTQVYNSAGSAGGDNSTPLTGAANIHQPVSQSVLNLPISPREIAYAQLVNERKERERRLCEERERYSQEQRLREEELRWREVERMRYRQHTGRLRDEELLREEARLLEESNRSKDSLALVHENFHQSYRPVLRGLSPLPSPTKRPADTSRNVPAKKKTWSKPASEKAPVTEDLMVYVGMKECELCKVTYNHPGHAKAHLIGKNHIKKLNMLGLPIPDYCIDKNKPVTSKVQVKSEENPEDEEDVPWPDWMQDMMKDDFCYICNTPLSSVVIADSHYYGKKHLKKCNAIYNQGEASNKSTPFYCDICHIYCSSLQIMDQHVAGSKHKQTAHWKRATQDRPLVSGVRVREMKIQEAENSASQFIANAAEMNGIGEKK